MAVVLLAAAVVLAWGLWLVPAQRSGVDDAAVRTLGIAASNAAVAVLAWALLPAGDAELTFGSAAAAACAGGVLWAVAGAFAMTATRRLGIASAMGIWSPLNVLTALAAGVLLFHELRGLPGGRLAAVSLAVAGLIAGLLLTVRARSGAAAAAPMAGRAGGLAAAAVAGVLWGVYFLPVQASGADVAAAALPMAGGMLLGALGLAARRLGDFRRVRPGPAAWLLASGGLWSIGNYASLYLMREVGTGVGFAIAQSCLAVNAVAGILLFADPPPGSRAARLILAGAALAAAAAAALGLLTA